MADKVGFPIPATSMVNLYWGNQHYAIQIATCPANMAMGEAFQWFKENDHFFHLENFPPYQRFLDFGSHVMVDYGSHANFLYLIPINI